MASKSLLMMLLPLALLVILLSGSADAQGLQVGFYSKTCPDAEAIVFQEVKRIISVARSLAGPLLRMHFHDCFVRGCDASILLNSTANNLAEKDSPPNLSLRGWDAIDGVKAKLEKACPGIVSCADILALIARDVVVLTQGPTWAVPTGRRDGNTSRLIDSLINLPPAGFNIALLINLFAQKGLDKKDLVVLSGAHTIGTSHCSQFTNRLYNFSGKNGSDPTLDSHYVPHLQRKCSPTDVTTLVEMDPGSRNTFDTGYFKQVSKRRGLFTADAALLDDPVAKAYVLRHANGFSSEFFADFGVSMVKMGNMQVLTGKQGEIRKQCRFVNN